MNAFNQLHNVVIQCLRDRAHEVCDGESRMDELKHLEMVFTATDTPSPSLDAPSTKPEKIPTTKRSQKRKKIKQCYSYHNNISKESLKKSTGSVPPLGSR